MRRFGVVLTLATLGFMQQAGVGTQEDAARLPAPLYPTAASALRDEDPEAGLAALDEADSGHPDADLARDLLRAALLDAAGRHDEAAAAWHDLTTVTLLTELTSRREIEALSAAGRPEAARERLMTLLDGRPVGEERALALTIAQTSERAGEPEAAADLYNDVLPGLEDSAMADAARLGLARTLESQDRLEEAATTLRETALLHRDTVTWQQARADELRVLGALGRDVPPFEEDEYRDLVDRLSSRAQYDSALELLEEWRRAFAATPRLAEIEALEIEQLYAARANEPAMQAAEAFLVRHATSEHAPRVRLLQFRIAVRLGETDEARDRGYALWNGRVDGLSRGDRFSAGSLLAAYLVAIGRVSEGLALYPELFRASPSPGTEREILWRAGVAALRADDVDRALTNLAAVIRRGPQGDLEPAARYWLGAARERAGDTAGAAATWARVEEEYARHYYGLQAADRLDRLAATGDGASRVVRSARARRYVEPLTFDRLEPGAAAREDRAFRAATILARAGLADDAADHVRVALSQHRGDEGLALLAVRAFADVGRHRAALQLAATHLGPYLRRPATNEPPDLLSLLYPKPFTPAVAAAARARAVDPHLLTALMRRESRFDPSARSAVGAIGLFQIMPYTAARLGVEAGVGQPDEAALHEPEINARIAATLVASLQGLFDRLAPVAASYNAGEERVADWWAAAEDLPEDLFVDTIPYSETRGFVREVTANYSLYRRLYPTPD